jgi:hypothetical protein
MTAMLQPKFRLASLLWLTACVACFFAGKQRQKEWDEHWWPTTPNAKPENSCTVCIRPDALNPMKTRTTIVWWDGRVLVVEGGRLPEYFPEDGLELCFPCLAFNREEKRQTEKEYGLPAGVLDR